MTGKSVCALPVLPLRDMVVYPKGVHPLFVGTAASIKALDAAMSASKQVLLVAKRDAKVEQPGSGDLFSVGTLATILQLLKLPDGTVKVLIEGQQRARIARLDFQDAHILADVEPAPEPSADSAAVRESAQAAMSQFQDYVQISKKVPQETLATVSGIDEPARLIDAIASHMPFSVKDKQAVLEAFDPKERAELLLSLMGSQFEVQRLEKDIRGRVKKQMEKSPARVLPERTDQGDTEGTRRDPRGHRRDRSAIGEDRRSSHACGGQEKGPRGTGQTQADGADVGGSHRSAQLSRLDAERSLEETQPRATGPSPRPADSR